jgi:hypothetical protein
VFRLALYVLKLVEFYVMHAIAHCVFLFDGALGGGGGVTGCSVLSASMPCQKVVYPQRTLQVLNIKEKDNHFNVIIGGGAYGNIMGLATGALRATQNVAIGDVDWKVRSRFASENKSVKREYCERNAVREQASLA